METVVIRKCDRLTNLPTSQQTRVGAYRSKKMVIAQPFFSAAPNFFVALLFGAKPFICGNPTPQCIHLLLPTPQRTRRSLTIQALRVVRIFILYSVFFSVEFDTYLKWRFLNLNCVSMIPVVFTRVRSTSCVSMIMSTTYKCDTYHV